MAQSTQTTDFLTVRKDLTILRDLVIEGNMTFGDASTDTLTVNASLRVNGQSKLYNRPLTTNTFALDVKSDYMTATGSYDGAFTCTMRLYPTGDTTTSFGRAGYFSAELHSGDTITASGGLCGLATIANNQGTINGVGAIVTGLHAYVEDGGVYTATSHVCSVWLDSHLDQAVTAGSHELLFMTNNGTTVMDTAIYIGGRDRISTIMTLEGVDGAAMVENGSVLNDISATANDGYIKVVVEGEDKYIALYDLKA